MLKCIQCTLQRTLVQKKIMRTLRTSNQINIKKLPEKETTTTKTPPKDNERIQNIPDEFKTVFNFPYIRHFALINKMKIYQTGITGLSTSVGLILNQLDYISTDMLGTWFIVGVAGCIPLYVIGYFTGNFIGYMFYNEKTKVAKISYADHWGRRKDLEIQADDIIPLSDLPVRLYKCTGCLVDKKIVSMLHEKEY